VRRMRFGTTPIRVPVPIPIPRLVPIPIPRECNLSQGHLLTEESLDGHLLTEEFRSGQDRGKRNPRGLLTRLPPFRGLERVGAVGPVSLVGPVTLIRCPSVSAHC